MASERNADHETVQTSAGNYPDATVTVENIGGIDRCDVSFTPGVTVLTGRNATNRTSFLTALADVLGGQNATLKTDAESGRIQLTLGDETYTREYTCHNGSFAVTGEQYSEREELIRLYGRLLADNPARRAVERGDDLRETIMEPVDIEQIQREIRDHERERYQIRTRLEKIDQEREQLPDLEERRLTLDEERERLETELSDVRQTIDKYEAGEVEAEQAEDLLNELKGFRQDLQQTETKLQNRKTSVADLREDYAETEAELDELTTPSTELDSVKADLEQLRQQKRTLTNTIDDLTHIISFNEDLVVSEETLPGQTSEDDVISELNPASQTVECWTCGSEVTRDEIATRLDELYDIVAERRSNRNQLADNIDDLEVHQADLEQHVEHKAELGDRLEDIERQLEFQKSEIEGLDTEHEAIKAEIDDLEEEVAETEELRESNLVDAYQRLSKLEYERGQVEQELTDVEAEIADREELAEEREQLAAQREELTDELEALRSRIDDLEESAIEQFNTRMDEVLELLAYENIARIWIERRGNGMQGESETRTFELHVVRESGEGAVYEDMVANLSESEREVIGLVVALAGYLVHEVYMEVPFILLDSLEAIDADRLAAFIEYFAEYAPFLVVALLPEDAAALSEDYEQVSASALRA